jgi:hypothetical protein
MRTRGFWIAYALIRPRKLVRGLRQGLTKQERYEVADAAVRQRRLT